MRLGTTGQPKGVQRDNGGHAVALNWSMRNIYNTKPGDVYWAARLVKPLCSFLRSLFQLTICTWSLLLCKSDVGWVVGHSYSVYGPLLHGLTTVFYEGKPVGTPDAGSFWRVIQQHNVHTMFTAPTALRSIKRTDEEGVLPKEYPMPSLQTVFLAGERADSDSIKWAEHALGVPVRDHWWQTETGWAICSNLIGVEGYLPIKYGSTYRPCPGFNVEVLDKQCQPVARGQLGNIAIKLPLPPGSLQTIYNSNERFLSSYLKSIPGYYDTGDAGYIDEDGYVFVMSRTDDVINVAGHRLSSGAMEEV